MASKKEWGSLLPRGETSLQCCVDCSNHSSSPEGLPRAIKVFRSLIPLPISAHLQPVSREDWMKVPRVIAQFAVLSECPREEHAFLARADQLEHRRWQQLSSTSNPLKRWCLVLRRALRALELRGLHLSTEHNPPIKFTRCGHEWGYFKCKELGACAIAETVTQSFKGGSFEEGKGELETGIILRYILLFDTGIPSALYNASLWKINAAGLDQLMARQLMRTEVATISGAQAELVPQLPLGLEEQTREISVPLEEEARVEGREQEPLAVLFASHALDILVPARDTVNYRISRPDPYLEYPELVLTEYQKLRELQRSMPTDSSLPGHGFTVEIPKKSHLNRWRLTLHPSRFSGAVQAQLRTHAACIEGNSKRVAAGSVVEMEITIPREYPFKPPFLRIISPRFAVSKGHITEGGSIHMPLLTEAGWVAACSLESVIVDVISIINEGINEGCAKIDHGNHNPYKEYEARESFERAEWGGADLWRTW